MILWGWMWKQEIRRIHTHHIGSLCKEGACWEWCCYGLAWIRVSVLIHFLLTLPFPISEVHTSSISYNTPSLWLNRLWQTPWAANWKIHSSENHWSLSPTAWMQGMSQPDIYHTVTCLQRCTHAYMKAKANGIVVTVLLWEVLVMKVS